MQPGPLKPREMFLLIGVPSLPSVQAAKSLMMVPNFPFLPGKPNLIFIIPDLILHSWFLMDSDVNISNPGLVAVS